MISPTRTARTLVIVTLFAAAATATFAQPQPTQTAESNGEIELSTTESKLRADLNSWIWVMSLDGTLGVRGVSVDIDASFSDILDASDSIVALSGRLELGYGRVAGFVDGMYSKLGVDNASGPADIARIDVTFEQTIVDFGLMYRIGDWEPTGNAADNRHNVTLDLYGGGRWSGIDIELDFREIPSRDRKEDWLDPIVGAKLVIPFAEHWRVAVNGDIGGFGVASDFTWSATGVIGYDFRIFDHPASVMCGYRAIGWDYSTGSGDSRFEWDIIQHGAIIGLSLLF